MSLTTRLPKATKTIGFKIAAGYSLLFAFSFMVLAGFAYILLGSALSRQERRMIADEVESLRQQYQFGGWPSFYNKVMENDRFRKNNPFFIRALHPPEGAAIVFFPQYWKDFDLSTLNKITGQISGEWIELPCRSRSYSLEIFTAAYADGGLFQVGISTEDRLSILHRFREIFLTVSIPLILLAACGGAFLSSRILRPLRNLIVTVASIDGGNLEAHVPVANTGDELDELGGLFNRMLEKINRLIAGMKGSLDSVAHDLRTPMTRFRNVAETALQKEQDPAPLREALQECLDESDRILRMLHMLMDISEAQAGTLRLNIRQLELVPLAEGVVDMYRYVAEEKDIRIETHFPGQALLEADADRVCQALANLIDNAIKFTQPGGKVQVSILDEAQSICMQVADSGSGIAAQEIPKIWDRLYRGANARHKGLGLGLSMVKAVAQAHQGEIEVSSTSGCGSVFSLHLPRRRPTPA